MLKRFVAAAFITATLVLAGAGVASAVGDMTHDGYPGMTHD